MITFEQLDMWHQWLEGAQDGDPIPDRLQDYLRASTKHNLKGEHIFSRANILHHLTQYKRGA